MPKLKLDGDAYREISPQISGEVGVRRTPSAWSAIRGLCLAPDARIIQALTPTP